MTYCCNCGKLQTELEELNDQCNDCDPFVDPSELEIFGEPFYKPTVKLIGEDGNIFNLLAICRKALREGLFKMLEKEVFSSKSYDEALLCIMKYVEVE